MKKEIVGMLSVVCVLCLVLTLALTGCGKKETVIGGDPASWGPSASGSETVQIPNPWQECDSLEDAGKIAGFPFAAPDALDGCSEKYIAAIENDVAQVIFSSDEDEDAEVVFRKGVGDQDISGDYTEYESVETRQIDGKDVTVKSSDGVIYTVLWVQDGYSYSVFSRTGMSEEQMNEWVQALA